MIATVPDRDSLAEHGIAVRGRVYWHPTTSQLYSARARPRRGALAEGGPLVVDTGAHTGRSPKDKFIVREPGSEARIWWGEVNAEISEDDFERLRDKVAARLGEGDVYVDRRVRGRRPGAPHRRARDHREPLARALREDALHRSDAETSSATWRRRHSSCTRRPSRPTPKRTARAAAPSSASTRPAPRW